jgi:hypothetical protein
MISLLIHAALGALTIGVFFYVNASVPERPAGLSHDFSRRALLRAGRRIGSQRLRSNARFAAASSLSFSLPTLG